MSSVLSILQDKIVIGSSDFNKVVLSSAFVDKTLLVKDLVGTNYEVVLITYPRRFGKSTNMNMVLNFLTINVDEAGIVIDRTLTSNYKLFNSKYKNRSFKIADHKEIMDNYLASFPVVFVSFLNIKGETNELIVSSIKNSIHESFEQHNYLLNSLSLDKNQKKKLEFYQIGENYVEMSINKLKISLLFLTKVLHQHFHKKVFVLIDEYDAPINNALYEKNVDLKNLNDLIDGILCKVFKENLCLQQGFMTGISSMGRASASSGLNNVKEFNFLKDHKFVNHYGFSRDEVAELFDYFSVDANLLIEADHWYDGYQIKNNPLKKIFNPWSIVNFMLTFKFDNFWQKSGSIQNILYIFRIKGIKEKIQDLITGNEISFTIKNNFTIEDLKNLQRIVDFKGEQLNVPSHINLFFTLILELGYLTYTANGSFRAPNNEIKIELTDYLIEYFVDTYKLTRDNFENSIDALNKGIENENDNFKDFESALTDLFKPIEMAVISSPSKEGIHPNEDIFHSLINTIAIETNCYKLGSEIWHERKARADCVIVNKKMSFATIIEIKFSKEESNNPNLASAAVLQAKKYTPIFEKYNLIKNFKFVGISISSDKSVKIETELVKK